MPYPSMTLPRTRLVALLCVFCLSSAFAEDDTNKPEDKPETVSLVIDYNDGAQMVFPAIPWKEDCTVLNALEFATAHRRGITCKIRGKGATALLYRIDDLENQGGSGLNWIFKVNGKLGDRSFAITSLEPGDRILWKFDEYR